MYYDSGPELDSRSSMACLLPYEAIPRARHIALSSSTELRREGDESENADDADDTDDADDADDYEEEEEE